MGCCSVFWILLIIIIFPGISSAEGRQILVAHPEVDPPYNTIVEEIIKGIKRGSGLPIASYSVPAKESNGRLKAWIQGHKGQPPVIAIGTRVHNFVSSLDIEQPVYAGALDLPPNTPVKGISIFIEPNSFFDIFKSLMPDKKRIFLIYRQDISANLIPLMNSAAQNHSLELVSVGVKNLREVAKQIDLILAKVGDADAVWLHRGVIRLNKEILLPLVVKSAWDKRIAIFSSEAEYVKRGILFSLFPDYQNLGTTLGRIAVNDDLSVKEHLVFLSDVKATLNVRTAMHLGIPITTKIKKRFDIIYPMRRD